MSAFPKRKRSYFASDASASDASASPNYWMHQPIPTLSRRLLAWGLEVAVMTSSIAVPFYLGGRINQHSEAPMANLAPVLQVAQAEFAKRLGIPLRLLPDRVAPATNLLWSLALGMPIVLTAAHLYCLSRYGKSWPKRLLGVQVLALDGQMPGWRRILLREVVGKWGGPLAIAYGIWQLSGLFPATLLLGGLGVFALASESLSGLRNRPRRPWHDALAGTCVVDQHTGAIIRLSTLWQDGTDTAIAARQSGASRTWYETEGGLTAVVLPPRMVFHSSGSRWLRSGHFRLLLLLLCGGLVGGSSYVVFRGQLSALNPDAKLYGELVTSLTATEGYGDEQHTTVLALGHLRDERVAPFLVNLIAQSDTPQWQDTVQRALLAQGLASLAPLRQLNQSLKADLASATSPASRALLTQRLQTVNQTLTKLILLTQSDRRMVLDLSHLHLGKTISGPRQFTLDLNHQDLSGMQWQGAILNQANFRGAQFYHVGRDRHLDTYDDRIANLSGADLTDAMLAGANLAWNQLVGAGLLRADLTRANLTQADLSRANLEQARLTKANLTGTRLVAARLSEADLTEAQLVEADLEAARLSGVYATGVDLSGATLKAVAAQAADFTDAHLSNTDWEGANLAGAQLVRANLQDARLQNASLENADLRHVWLQGADLSNANLAGSILATPAARGQRGFVTTIPEQAHSQRFAGANFSQTRNLSPEQIILICAWGGLHPACEPLSPE